MVFLWITFGTIFAGGVHDYFSGMMSERNDGASIAEVTGRYLGPVMQNIMRVFSVVLLIMVGTVFAVGPAGLIVTLCKNSGSARFGDAKIIRPPSDSKSAINAAAVGLNDNSFISLFPDVKQSVFRSSRFGYKSLVSVIGVESAFLNHTEKTRLCNIRN